MAAQIDSVSAGNKYIVCQYKGEYYSTFGNFFGENPFKYSVPLILTQISLISITSQVIQFCLRPLRQSSIVALILGGIVFGPSLLGQKRVFSDILFPVRSIVTLETASTFGAMFFFFAVGVKQDSSLMIRPGRRAASVAIAGMTGTLVMTLAFAFLLKKYVKMEDTMANALPVFAASQCLTAFPNIACLLTELKIDNSDLGQVAISAALLCDFIGISLTATSLAILQSFQHPFESMMMLLSTVVFLLSLVFIVRPLIRKAAKKIPAARSLPERYVLICFLGTLLAGFVSETIGQHYMLGPLVFGLMVPDGQKLGEPIISKLDYPIGKLIYPIFLTTSGLKTNFFMVDPRSLCIGILLISIACMSKIVCVMIASLLFGMKLRDAFVLGLMLNGKGICELVLYNLERRFLQIRSLL